MFYLLTPYPTFMLGASQPNGTFMVLYILYHQTFVLASYLASLLLLPPTSEPSIPAILLERFLKMQICPYLSEA